MTTLLVEPLVEGVELYSITNLNLNTRQQLGSIAPYIFMKGAPVGDFYIVFEKTDGSFSLEMQFDSDYIKGLLETTDDNAHVFIPFVPSMPVFLEKGEYKLSLYSENYTFRRSAFIGWVRQHENLNNELDYTPSNDAENPLAFRLKTLKEGLL
jgi:hypothetical protein